MSKLLLVTFAVLMVAICSVSAGPACSKYGGSCSIGAGKIQCCMGYLCNAKDLKCEMYVGPNAGPGSSSGSTRPPSRGGSGSRKGGGGGRDRSNSGSSWV